MVAAGPLGDASGGTSSGGRVAAPYGDYIVYVDESGDHGLAGMGPNYPVFVLAFCIFEKRVLAADVVPAVLRFKFAHFGHGQIVLHEHEIRKTKNAFRFLTDAVRRQPFVEDLNALMRAAPCSQVLVDLLMADKKTITTGLQLADLVARPIGLHVLRPGQANRAYDVLEPKLRRGPGSQIAGYGLRVFPP